MKKLLVLFLCILLFCPSAFAGPRYTAALSAAKVAAKKQDDFSKKVARLSRAERLKLKRQLNGSTKYGANSDGDSLPDIYEEAIGSNLCSEDSDGDGRDDDTDDDEGEVEIKGLVTSFATPTLVVGDKRFTLTASTIFRGSGFDASDLIPGACIEIKGRVQNDSLNAVRIKREDDCDGEGSDD
jgi:hypothetical protein